jgi:hypothetical protein
MAKINFAAIFVGILCIPIIFPFMFYPTALFNPYFLVALIGGFTIWFILFLVTLRTSAFQWLSASFGKSHIIINPMENKYLEFIPAKLSGSLGFIKDKGFYLTDPSDTYIEGKSKVPVTISYGNFALPIDPKQAAVSSRLAELGIKNYVDLVNYVAAIRGVSAEQLKKIEEERAALIKKMEEDPKHAKHYADKIEKLNKLNPNVQMPEVKLWGESVPLDNILNYFGKDERSDVIESEIQRRTAAQQMLKLGGAENILKWAVFILIILIGAGLLYTFINMGGSHTSGGSSLIPKIPLPNSLQPATGSESTSIG